LLSAFGWRNLGFIIATALLMGLDLESIGPHGPDAGKVRWRLCCCGILELRFSWSSMVVEVIKGLIRGQVVLRAVIGCVLPFVISYAFMELMEIWPI